MRSKSRLAVSSWLFSPVLHSGFLVASRLDDRGRQGQALQADEAARSLDDHGGQLHQAARRPTRRGHVPRSRRPNSSFTSFACKTFRPTSSGRKRSTERSRLSIAAHMTTHKAKIRNWAGGICVLAGNYPTSNDKVAQRTLKFIKEFQPQFLRDVEAQAQAGPGR